MSRVIRFQNLVLAGAALLACAAGVSGCTVAGTVVGAVAAAGVAASHERGLEATIDDNKISLSINAALIGEDPELFARVSTKVVEGRVLLAGVVPAPEDKVTASRLAWTAPGVREIINEIQVTEGDGLAGLSKDSWILTKLKTRLLADTDISSLNYSIEAVRATVYLMGIAQSQEELERVIRHARDIKGVRNIVSYVQQRTDPARPGNVARAAPQDPHALSDPEHNPELTTGSTVPSREALSPESGLY